METNKKELTREDFIQLIKTSDALEQLDDLLKNLTGVGHGSGRLYELDSFYDVLFRHAKEEYTFDEEGEAQFYRIVTDRTLSIEDRVDMLMG